MYFKSYGYGLCFLAGVILVFIIFPPLLCMSGNKHQLHPLVSAETVHHSIPYSILYVFCQIFLWCILLCKDTPWNIEVYQFGLLIRKQNIIYHIQFMNIHNKTTHVRTICTMISTKHSKSIFVQRKYKVSSSLVAYWRWINGRSYESESNIFCLLSFYESPNFCSPFSCHVHNWKMSIQLSSEHICRV